VAQFIKACQTAVAILTKCDASTTDLFIDPKTLFEHEKVKESIQLLETNTFKEDRTFFFHHGRVLYTHKLLLEHAPKFFPLLQFIGSLDAYFSIATLYRENQNSERKISFPHYDTQAEAAYIDAHDAWLTLLPQQSVVQPITIGTRGVGQKLLITGPNKGGKSMYLKMTGLNSLLAQTWGIIPAAGCILTPFAQIRTCLDPEGDISRGLSRFGTQKRMLAEFETLIEQCAQKGEFGLFLIDEILNGTVEDEASERTVEFGKKIAPDQHALVLITTHLEHPTVLERLTSKKFMNYHIEIIPENGAFRRTFYLRPGPATWWFKDKVQRKRYINLMDVKAK
jgi:DNA mismatch repair ATPase MutS